MMIILAVVLLGAAVIPFLIRKQPSSPTINLPALAQEEASHNSVAALPAAAKRTAIQQPKEPVPSLLERVACLPPLTAQQVEAYVSQNKSNVESLVAAYRATADKSWLIEAASRFPNHPDVQYAVIATRAFPEVQRQWINAYKTGSPDNALGFYLSALDHFKVGVKSKGLQDLAEATRKSVFRLEPVSTLQAVEEVNLSAGRAPDEARIAAFQTVAQSPELTQMRDLANVMKDLIQQYQQHGDVSSAASLANMGIILGAHLCDGTAGQTVINQLVGIGIQKTFLQQLEPGARDPFGRPVAEASAAIERRQAALKEYSQMMKRLTGRLNDNEWAVYMERVKLYGEESALAWLKSKNDQQ